MTPEREWLTRNEIIGLVTTDLDPYVRNMVREMLSEEMQPYHKENKERFAHIEQELALNATALAVIGKTNDSQNREIANIGSRQAERYVQQVKEEERAQADRCEMISELKQIKANASTNELASAKRDGRKEQSAEYWTTGKKIVAGGATLATGAFGKTLWPFIKRLFHH